MNSVIENIKNRRSVRFYDSKPIPKDIIDIIIESGILAPTGSNMQPWRFVVVQDNSVRKKLADIALTIYKKWITTAPEQLQAIRKDIDAIAIDPIYYSAPAIIFVIGKGSTSDFDCSMACENMMLAARSFGIGSCWVFFGQFPIQVAEIKEMLELKEGEKVYGPIIMGYPKDSFPPVPSKKIPAIKWI